MPAALVWLIALGGLLPAQSPVVYRVRGAHWSDHFGSSLAVLNDIDGDSVNDFVAGATQQYIDPELKPWGYVRLISGRRGEVLRTWRGSDEVREFGYSLVAMGDLDGDGKMDFATAGGRDVIFILSPLKDEPLKTFHVQGWSKLTAVYGQFASADLDGDGIQDLIVGDDGHILEMSRDFVINVGRVLAYSGADWRTLWDVVGATEQGMLGISVAVVGDVDGDGLPDVAVGEPMGLHQREDNRPGRVRILRGRDGSLLRMIDDDPGFYLGYRLANLGDLDGDRFPELAIASPGYRRHRGRDQGWVGVYSTRTFEVLQQFTGHEGELTLGFKGDALGYAMGSVGDVDLDGTPDYLLAAYRVGEGIGPDWGRLDLRSGRSGALLASYQEEQWESPWLGSIAPLGDIDGDGRPEFLLGSPNTPTYPHPQNQHGEVVLLRFEPDQPRFIRGDANGDGRVNITDAVAILRKTFSGIESGGCLEAFDVNADGFIGLLDSIHLLRYLFTVSYAPAPPFPECARFGGLRPADFDCRSPSCGR